MNKQTQLQPYQNLETNKKLTLSDFFPNSPELSNNSSEKFQILDSAYWVIPMPNKEMPKDEILSLADREISRCIQEISGHKDSLFSAFIKRMAQYVKCIKCCCFYYFDIDKTHQYTDQEKELIENAPLLKKYQILKQCFNIISTEPIKSMGKQKIEEIIHTAMNTYRNNINLETIEKDKYSQIDYLLFLKNTELLLNFVKNCQTALQKIDSSYSKASEDYIFLRQAYTKITRKFL
jgi:hypothetical protein